MAQHTARSPHVLRRMNSGALLQFALDTGEFTTAEAMSASRLSRVTVLGVLDELVEAGWIEEVPAATTPDSTRPGRPTRRYRLRRRAGIVVGVNAGEYFIDLIVADLRGEELDARHLDIAEDGLDGEGRVRRVQSVVDAALKGAGSAHEDVLLTVVGVPAPVDEVGQSPEGEGTFWPLMNPGFANRLEGTVIVENDANLAVTVEHAAMPSSNVAALLADDRFGAGLVVDGRLLRGGRGGAGEMRFLDVLGGEGVGRGAGATDGLGALAATWAREGMDGGDVRTVLRDLSRDELGAEDVIRAAEGGDAFATGIVERMGERLARIAVVFESVLDVDNVVISGRLAAVVAPVLEHARAVLETQYYPPFPELSASVRGADAVTKGAIEHALAQVREHPLDFVPRPSDDRPCEQRP